jgi:hypothetical protein
MGMNLEPATNPRDERNAGYDRCTIPRNGLSRLPRLSASRYGNTLPLLARASTVLIAKRAAQTGTTPCRKEPNGRT